GPRGQPRSATPVGLPPRKTSPEYARRSSRRATPRMEEVLPEGPHVVEEPAVPVGPAEHEHQRERGPVGATDVAVGVRRRLEHGPPGLEAHPERRLATRRRDRNKVERLERVAVDDLLALRDVVAD